MLKKAVFAGETMIGALMGINDRRLMNDFYLKKLESPRQNKITSFYFSLLKITSIYLCFFLFRK